MSQGPPDRGAAARGRAVRGLAGVLVTALAAGLLVEGVQVRRLSGRVEELEKRLAAGAPEADLGVVAPAGEAPTRNARPTLAAIATRAGASRPALAATAVPLPEALSSPAAREQLSRFVRAEMDRARASQREERLDRREQRENDLYEKAIGALKLSEAEAGKLGEILSKLQADRRALVASVRAGEKPASELGPGVASLREQADKDAKALLGEEKFGKLTELRRGSGRP